MRTTLSIEILSKFDVLFHQINPEELEIILQFTQRVKLKQGQYLFYEDTPGDSIYLIKSGKMAVEARGQLLTHLFTGSYFGEMSILDNKPRSSSVYADESSELYRLNMLDLQRLHPELYAKLIVNISKILPERLRKTNELAANSLKKEIGLLKSQVNMGRFLVYVLTIMALFIFVLRFIDTINPSGEITTASDIRVTLVLAFVFFVLMWSNGYQLDSMGLTLRNSKQALLEALILSFFVIGIIIFAKWLLITNIDAFKGTPLFLLRNDSQLLLEICLGYIIFSPIQEFIARGCLQSLLMQFINKNPVPYYPIIISNIIFCSFSASFTLTVPLILFVLGLLWGWLYSRQPTLVGVSLSHALIGICITGVVGLPIKLF